MFSAEDAYCVLDEVGRTQPIHARLGRALVSSFGSAIKALQTQDAQEFLAKAMDVAEIASWFSVDATAPDAGTVDRTTANLLTSGVDFSTAVACRKRMLERKIGRPQTGRIVAVKALEKKYLRPDTSWMQLAIELCPCRKDRHDLKCRERLRQRCLMLNKILRQYGV